MRERNAIALPGLLMVLVVIALFVGAAYLFIVSLSGGNEPSAGTVVGSVVLTLLGVIAASGFVVIQPNHSAVVVFLGSYLGTVHRSGFIWTWPLTERRTVSLRVKNFDSQILKVNDAVGNPIEVAAVVVWRVVDTAKAVFDVEDYEEVRQDPDRNGRPAWPACIPTTATRTVSRPCGQCDAVTDSLHKELQEHLRAGVEVSGRSSAARVLDRDRRGHAPRQQRMQSRRALTNVEGAVGMVEMALACLTTRVSSTRRGTQGGHGVHLLVVLCGRQWRSPWSTPGRSPVVGMASARASLRISPELYEALERWAADELRSTKPRRYMLVDAARRAGRDRRAPGEQRPSVVTVRPEALPASVAFDELTIVSLTKLLVEMLPRDPQNRPQRTGPIDSRSARQGLRERSMPERRADRSPAQAASLSVVSRVMSALDGRGRAGRAGRRPCRSWSTSWSPRGRPIGPASAEATASAVFDRAAAPRRRPGCAGGTCSRRPAEADASTSPSSAPRRA